MTLITSISGIRGTLGGKAGEGLSPVDIMKYTIAYGSWLQNRFPEERLSVLIGRDARISGPVVNNMVVSTLQFMGIDIIDAGMAPTPTIGIGVREYKCQGGIIITASHNPKNWNALKLLNEKGEFLNSAQGEEMMAYTQNNNFTYATADKIGKYTLEESAIEMHIEKVLALDLVDADAIANADFHVVIDAVNSVGGIAIPELLEALGVRKITELFCDPNGLFPHNPEPLPENLSILSEEVAKSNAHVGFALDPDVDRLAIICNNGEMFGEEYTLVSIADYVLQHTPGNTVSNLSSTQALKDITLKNGAEYHASAVGEINVVEKMKEVNAVIGGEGNGGVIYPPIHYGRDALTGIALFLTHLAKTGKTVKGIKKDLPDYFISKHKIELSSGIDLSDILSKISEKYSKHPIDKTDGVKIMFDKEWVHLRKSNTEPIIRIYAESDSEVKSESLAKKLMKDISELIR
ncbi:MAG: phosphoglucosamine mutase [Bacteroidetes bacterium]|nr:MAG: phosphoglucosamine mutase [Bacteroidota bacterium]